MSTPKKLNRGQMFLVCVATMAVCLGIGMAAALLSGCQTAAQKAAKQQAKVTKASDALRDNRDLQVAEAAKQVFATGVALDLEPSITPALRVAEEFNALAQATLGEPSVQDVTVLKEMVTGLLSTNAQLKAAAELQKKDLLADITQLQAERDELRAVLKKAEDRRDADYQNAAAKATIYDKWRARLYWIIGIVGGGFLLSIVLPALSTAFPFLAPFAAIVNGVFGTIVRGVFRIAPQAMDKAGVVGQQAFSLSERTLTDLVKAIGEVKKTNKSGFETVLEPALKDATDPNTSRKKILEIQDRLSTLSPAK